MTKRLTVVMTLAVLLGFATIMLMNIAALVGFMPSKYISPNDVRGVAVEHNGLLYTLNFNQQNTMIEIFNRAIPVNKDEIEKRKFTKSQPEIQKIIIYQFNAPDIEITPIAYVGKSVSVTNQDRHPTLTFSAPAWNANSPLEETAPGELYKLIPTTFDP